MKTGLFGLMGFEFHKVRRKIVAGVSIKQLMDLNSFQVKLGRRRWINKNHFVFCIHRNTNPIKNFRLQARLIKNLDQFAENCLFLFKLIFISENTYLSLFSNLQE